MSSQVKDEQSNLLSVPPSSSSSSDYDPRRLFPFGLSPIPEVPSELASEVSSICSPTPTEVMSSCDSSSSSDVEDVIVRSIMYSGSCSSIKSNKTLTKSDSDSTSSSEEEDDDDIDDDDDDDNDDDDEDDDEEEQEDEEDEEDTDDNSERETKVLDSSGAITASEIFRHLQATKEKEEVTTELAKILDVLQTTLHEDSSSPPCEKETSTSITTTAAATTTTTTTITTTTTTPTTTIVTTTTAIDNSTSMTATTTTASSSLALPPPMPSRLGKSKSTGYANNPKFVTQEIANRIKELQTPKKRGNAKEEMSILSKILVTLLCSCRSAAATEELKKIIRQFKEAAMEAADEVGGFEYAEESKRKSSSKRRSRKSSKNSLDGNSSETESTTNTLTPNNTDKSSGTDEEGSNYPDNNVASTLRFNVKLEGDNVQDEVKEDPNVTFVVTLPIQKAREVVNDTEKDLVDNNVGIGDGDNDDDDNDECGDEEWEWEDDDDVYEENSVNKILSEMECGAYNSAESVGSPGQVSSNSQASPKIAPKKFSDGFSTSIESFNDVDDDDDDQEEEEERRNVEKEAKRKESDNVNVGLFVHLEETFKVLNGAYRIITGSQYQESSFEKILTDLSDKANDFKRNLNSESPLSDQKLQSHQQQQPIITVSETTDHQKIRPTSRRSLYSTSSRPQSSRSCKTPLDDAEWEYYYYDDEGEEEEELQRLSSSETTAPTTRATSPFPETPKRLPPVIQRADISSFQWEEVEKDEGETMKVAAHIKVHDESSLSMAQVSLALAAEYLGQKKEDVVASLPADFIPESPGKKRKKKRKEKREDDEEENEDDDDKKTKKKKRKKRKKKKSEVPERIGVKELVSRLEPKLFQDQVSGSKMVMTRESAQAAILRSRKSEATKNQVIQVIPPITTTPTTTVTMRNKNKKATNPNLLHVLPRSPRSPTESEAYGTGSTGSVALGEEDLSSHNNQVQSSRHSRLFKLIQDSDYTDSSETESVVIKNKRIGVSMKSLSDKDYSDEIESLCSVRKPGSSRSSVKESDCESMVSRSSRSPRKIVEISSSPIINLRRKSLTPMSRSGVWSFLQEEFDSNSVEPNIAASDDSSCCYSQILDSEESKYVRKSPKLDMELQELQNFPSAPEIHLQDLKGSSSLSSWSSNLKRNALEGKKKKK